MRRDSRGMIVVLFIAVMLLGTLAACGGTKDPDVSNKIYLETAYFETQEVAEALLTAKGIPYTVVDAGTTNGSKLAEVVAEHIILKDGQSGYYVNKGETAVLKVFTYEPEPDAEQENTPSEPPDAMLPSEAPETQGPDDAGGSDTVFTPKDVSDETIMSIKTYDDYLAMYRAIIEDYLANYEEIIKGTVLYSEEAFADMRKQYDDAFEQQKGMYGAMGKSPIVGKDSLVDVLIEYRDGLKSYTDSLAESLK